jgi:hypothetical protein
MGRVSPLLHQPGSTTHSPPTSATMGGGYCLTAVPPMLLAPVILLYHSTAPFSDAITENSWPQTSWAGYQKLAQINAMLARMSMEPLSHSPPPPTHCRGSLMPSACDLPSAQVSPPDCLAKGLMAPSPATTEAAMPLPSLAHPSMPAQSYPSHSHQTMGGIPEGLMAPSTATTEAATPSLSLARPFLLTQSSPTHPLPTMGGSAALAACHALECSQQRLAFTMSKCPGFADANPWVMVNINSVTLELQCWYQPHSICQYLARQTQQHLATTTIQCWKQRICLNCWFAQQALQRQKCLRLQLLCRSASAYAVSVRGDCRPPSTLTDKTFDPKVLRHPFQDCGLRLPQRRQAQQNNCPRCRLGQRNRPCAPDSGGGPLCMPLCFWAAQSTVAALELCIGTGRSLYSLYLPPHTAATAIQRLYCFYIDKVDKEWKWRLKLSLARYALERDMNRAMQHLQDSNTFFYLVCNSYWIPRWDGR